MSNVDLAKAVGLSPSPCMIRVVVADIQLLEEFILKFLTKLPGVGNIRSSFALKQVKYQTALPLPEQKRQKGDGRPSRKKT